MWWDKCCFWCYFGDETVKEKRYCCKRNWWRENICKWKLLELGRKNTVPVLLKWKAKETKISVRDHKVHCDGHLTEAAWQELSRWYKTVALLTGQTERQVIQGSGTSDRTERLSSNQTAFWLEAAMTQPFGLKLLWDFHVCLCVCSFVKLWFIQRD